MLKAAWCQLANTLSIDGIGCLCRVVRVPGSWIVHPTKQSGNTGAVAALAVITFQLLAPTVVIIKDGLGNCNAETVAEDLAALLKPFGIEVCYASCSGTWQTGAALGVGKFKEGKLVLVLSGFPGDLNDFLDEHLIKGTCDTPLCMYSMCHWFTLLGIQASSWVVMLIAAQAEQHKWFHALCWAACCHHMSSTDRMTALPMLMLHWHQHGC